MTAKKSSLNSLVRFVEISFWRMSTIFYFSQVLICSASSITSSFKSSKPCTSFPFFDTFIEYLLIISEQIIYIFEFDSSVIWSMKSLMASLALYESMLRICLLLTKLLYFMVLKMDFSVQVGIKRRFLSYFLGCLNKTILL